MKADVSGLIDHTVLGTDVDVQKVGMMCEEAREYQFKSIVLQPCRVLQAVEFLRGARISVGTVCGFPFGGDTTNIKAASAAESVASGANEIDMVMNVGWLKEGHVSEVRADIKKVVEASRAASEQDVIIKVIIEACLLTDDEKRRAAQIVKEAGADFVKTSTGCLGPDTGAKVEDVAILREVVGPDFGVKASGGIRTMAQLNDFVEAGANRIGTSAGVAIMNEKL